MSGRHFYVARARCGHVTNAYADAGAAQMAADWIDACVDAGRSIDKRMVAGEIAIFGNGVRLWRVAPAAAERAEAGATRDEALPAVFLLTLGPDDLPDTAADKEEDATSEALHFSRDSRSP